MLIELKFSALTLRALPLCGELFDGSSPQKRRDAENAETMQRRDAHEVKGQ
jgi:hypothetical protein